jgi:DNA-binding beta-propeller fold protein YncE
MQIIRIRNLLPYRAYRRRTMVAKTFFNLGLVANLGVVALTAACATAAAENRQGFLETIHRHSTLTSTVPGNGDLNPYAVVVAPVSAGAIHQNDVLVDNFNNISNLQGTGTTIVDYNPETRRVGLFAKLPRQLTGCPGGVGLTTAMTMLKSGWIIVGSTPSTDGTTKTKSDGCLIVLDANGKLAGTIAGPNINGPWGNMAVIDNGTRATLFISMAGTVPGPDVKDAASGDAVVVNKATVLRLELSIPDGRSPVVTGQTVVADGFGAQADKDAFMIGPTGIVLAPDGTTLYVSDAVGNRVVAVPDAPTRTTSAGTGREITKDGLLKRPLAMVMAPNGNLLVCNALNGQVVEIDPRDGKQLYAQWIDTDQAQTPPGNGDLFGIVMAPDGKGFYYVEDDVNTVMEAR